MGFICTHHSTCVQNKNSQCEVTDNLVKSFWETIQKGGYFYEKKKCNKDARGNNNDINAHSRLDRMWWIGQQWQ